jgi:hypothetical protein
VVRCPGAAQLHEAADGPRDHATARSSNTARGPRLSEKDVVRVNPISPTEARDRASRLATGDPAAARGMALAIEDPWFRCQALASAARHADEAEVEQVAQESLAAAAECHDDYKRAAVAAWPIRASRLAAGWLASRSLHPSPTGRGSRRTPCHRHLLAGRPCVGGCSRDAEHGGQGPGSSHRREDRRRSLPREGPCWHSGREALSSAQLLLIAAGERRSGARG